MNDVFKHINLSENSKVLDYGTGTGILSHAISQKYGCEIDAIDISREAVEGAADAWSDDKINWIWLDEFDFPCENYDLIISSQVIEHIHNVGNYLKAINNMLKRDGVLMIGTPNALHFGYLWRQLRCREDRLVAWSRQMLSDYDKGMDHINAWDTYHFITLLASCGFEMIHFFPTEGVVIPRWKFLNIIPSIRKTSGGYISTK